MTRNSTSTRGASEAGGRQSAGGPPVRQRRFRKFVRWMCLGLFVLLILYLGLVFWSKQRIRRVEREIAATGGSLVFADHVPAEIPASENASYYLEAASKLMQVEREKNIDLTAGQIGPNALPPGKPRSLVRRLSARLGAFEKPDSAAAPEDWALLRLCLERCDLIYRILDEAMPLDRARFDTDYVNVLPVQYEVPNLVSRLNFGRLLQARALLAMHDGRTEEAYADMAKIFRLARWVDQETPASFGTYISASIARSAIRTVNMLMHSTPPESEEVNRILDETRRLDVNNMFHRAIVSERASIYSTFVDGMLDPGEMAADLDEITGLPLALLGIPASPWVRMNAWRYSDVMTRAIVDSQPPAYKRPREWEDEFDERYDPGTWAPMARVALLDCFSFSRRRDTLIADMDMMNTAFRLEEYHREFSHYPDNLTALNDDTLVDPFSGKSYHYRRTGNGYVMHSIGANRVDDSGTPAPAPWKLTEGDVVWVMERQ